MWAHSVNGAGQRHALVDHLRSTAALARRFASPFGAGDLAEALGLVHDAGKADCGWPEKLLEVEGYDGRPVGRDHKALGTRMLFGRAGVAAMAILGHHGGLTDTGALRQVVERGPEPHELQAESTVTELLPEVAALIDDPSLIPEAWRERRLTLEVGLRLTFSALVDADHLDTAVHFGGDPTPVVRSPVRLGALAKRFEAERASMLAGRRPSPIDDVRAELYLEVVEAARIGPGLFRFPAPTGSGKTMTAAGFALHHGARNGQSRVIVAVPFTTITEQNAQVYRELLGSDNVLEHQPVRGHAQKRRWSVLVIRREGNGPRVHG